MESTPRLTARAAATAMAAATDTGTLSGGAGGVTLRAFQRQIVELAREQNVVMVGDTGIGKTFVAIALLSEQDYNDGRRAFFLAPTRQLVWQITAKIRASSTLRANAFCGSGMDQWGEREWRRELMLTRVFVCTPEVLRTALERGFVAMDMINLLVFDECHHVTKRHPYAHVIKMYDPKRPQDMPRVFGTTACPTRNCAKNLHATLHKVELQEHETAAFAAVAPIQFETYEKEEPASDSAAATPPTGRTFASSRSTSDDDDDEEEEGRTAEQDELEQWLSQQLRGSGYAPLLDCLAKIKAVAVLNKLLVKGRSDAARDDARRAKVLRKFVLTCAEMYTKWGLWCVYKYIELEIERAAHNASLLLCTPTNKFGYDGATITAIMLAKGYRRACAFAGSKRLKKVVELLASHTEDDGAPGVAGLYADRGILESEADTADVDDELSENSGVESEPESVASPQNSRSRSLQGIVFVTTRAECRVLCEYLNAKLGNTKSEKDSDDEGSDDETEDHESPAVRFQKQKDPRFACVLGQAATRDTASYNLPKMEETLTKFEKGSIEFLVSTAVSIEGVDFPQCALIIVADRIPASRKLMQLRGRARHEDGVVYYLAEEGDREHAVHFQVMKVEAEAINSLSFVHDKQETILQQPRSKAAVQLAGFDFFPAESRISISSTGAVLDLDSSISRLNMFCQTLPPTLYTIDYKNMYTFVQEEVSRRPMFRAKLQLPVELQIPQFETQLMHSKATAKATAAFLACKHLLEHGLMDDSLNSVYRKGKMPTTLDADNLSYFLKKLHT